MTAKSCTDDNKKVWYRVLGDETTVQDYAAKRGSRNSNDEWAALYMQQTPMHALGNLPYRWDQGYTTANLVQLSFLSHWNVFVLEGPFWSDPNISGNDKAARVKQQLGIPATVPLMSHLPAHVDALVMEETPGEWEIIVPFARVTKLATECQQTVVATFRQKHYCRLYGRKVPTALSSSSLSSQDSLTNNDEWTRLELPGFSEGGNMSEWLNLDEAKA